MCVIRKIIEPRVGCHVLSGSTVVIDRAGNILDCQNFTAADKDENGEAHLLGSILGSSFSTYPKPPLSRLHERLPACRDCPVFRLCSGGCAFTSSEYAAYNCRARYHEYMVTLGLAFSILTDGEWVLADVLQEEVEQA